MFKDQHIDEQRRIRNLRAHGMTHGLRRWNPYGTSSCSSGGRWGTSSYMRNPRPAAQMPRFTPPVAADSWPAAYAPPMRRYNPDKYFNPFLRNRNPEFNPFLRNPEFNPYHPSQDRDAQGGAGSELDRIRQLARAGEWQLAKHALMRMPRELWEPAGAQLHVVACATCRRHGPIQLWGEIVCGRSRREFNPFLRRNPNNYRRNPEIEIIFKMNMKTGKKDIIIDVHSDSDTLAHEHERDHKKIVEQLIGQGIVSAAEVGEVTIKRGGKVPAPLKGKKEPPATEKKAISTRKKAKKAKRKYNRKKR